jgi:signal transduction histidine kinase/ligand-binding sensor domain-containing protein
MAEPHSIILFLHGQFAAEHLARQKRTLRTCSRFLILSLVLATQRLPAQSMRPVALDPQKALTQYTQQFWETGKTPLEGAIRAILQTQDGYIWIGTQEGLYAFDSEHFRVYNSGNTPEMKNSSVYALAEDKDGTVWIGTRDGLIAYRDRMFKRYSIKEGLTSNSILSLSVDHGGVLWIGSAGGGLVQFSDGAFRSCAREGDLRFGTIWSLCSAHDSSLWIGTSSAGVARIKNGRESRYTARGGMLSDVIRSVCEGQDGSIWVGTHLGVNRIKNGKVTTVVARDGLSSDVVMQLYVDSQGTLWIGTGGGGLDRLAGGKITSLTTKNGLTNDNVLSFLEDREGNLWVGTADGLNQYKDQAFTTFTFEEGLSNDVVWCSLGDSNGAMWFGTNSGLNRLQGTAIRSFTIKNGMSNNTVRALCEDSKGTLWIGTYGGGLSEMRNGRVIRSGLNRPQMAYVYSITEDSQRVLWIGTSDGLFSVRDGIVRRYSSSEGMAGNFVRFVHQDRANGYWIGTTEGLSYFSENHFINYTAREGLSSNALMCCYEDNGGVVWFGTVDGGLVRFKDAVFTVFTVRDGLPENNVYQILEDDLGNLWLGGDRGICRINKKELNDYASGRISYFSTMMFGKKDGLRVRQCNGGSQPSSWKAKDGRLWFSMTKGVAVVDPHNLKINTVPPAVVIQQVLADNNDLRFSTAATLEAGITRIEVHYAALSFVSPSDVTFSYMLEGYDKNWVSAGNARAVTYTNIPPGHYIFRVIAANENGTWNLNGAFLAITLRPYFYQTTTFTLLLLLFVVGGATAGYWMRTKNLVRRTHELESTVSRRTDEIVRQKNALENANKELNELLKELEEKSRQLEVARSRAEEANQTKSSFLANVSHELRTPLNSVIGFTNILLKNKGQNLKEQDLTYLERILENGKHLLELIEDVLDLSRIEAGRMDIRRSPVSLEILIHETIAQIEGKLIGKEMAVIAEMPSPMKPIETDAGKFKQILINLLGNAIKFTDHGSIRVRVAIDQSTRRPVRVDVVDTGIGIPRDQQRVIFEPFTQGDDKKTRRYGGTGLGLAISRTLCDMLGYTMELQSEVGVGSTFSILLGMDSRRAVYADQETLRKDKLMTSIRDAQPKDPHTAEKEIKEKILMGLQPFSHGEWAHMNVNRVALFGRNLNESLSPRQYDRFRAALTEYLVKVQPSIARMAQLFEIIHVDPNLVQTLTFHADELGTVAGTLSVNARITDEEARRYESEIPKHVDQLLHAFRVLREMILREFQCNPGELLQAILEERTESSPSVKLTYPRPLSAKNPRTIGTNEDFARIIELLIDTPLIGREAVSEGRELFFVVRTVGDRWMMEMRDSSITLDPSVWATVFEPAPGGQPERGLALIPLILAKYGGDICIKETVREGGTTVLLRMKVAL